MTKKRKKRKTNTKKGQKRKIKEKKKTRQPGYGRERTPMPKESGASADPGSVWWPGQSQNCTMHLDGLV